VNNRELGELVAEVGGRRQNLWPVKEKSAKLERKLVQKSSKGARRTKAGRGEGKGESSRRKTYGRSKK